MSYRRKHIQPKIRKLKQRKKLTQRTFFWIFSLIFILSAALFSFALFFPKFQISNIEVSGNERISSEEIESAASDYLGKKSIGRSIFFASAKKAEKNIMDKFPAIEEVNAKKKFPNGISFTIKERKQFAVSCSNDAAKGTKCFLIDSNGIIFEQAQDELPEDMIVIVLDGKKFSLGESAVSKDIVDAISKVNDNLKNNFQLSVKKAMVSNFLIFETSEGWQVHFDPASDINLQIVKLNSLLENEISAGERKNLQYIYLQYKDRVYYK